MNEERSRSLSLLGISGPVVAGGGGWVLPGPCPGSWLLPVRLCQPDKPFVQPSFLSIGPSFLHPCRGHKDAIVGVVGSCQGLSKIICMIFMICFLLACVCV